MPVFTYSARNRTGEKQTGELEAQDAASASRALAERGLFPLEIREPGATRIETTAGAHVHGGFLASLRERFSNPGRDLARKTEQLAQLLRAGLKLSEALRVLAVRSDSPRWREIFQDLQEAVIGGESLHVALRREPRVFGGMYREMVAAGEASGHLTDILERLALHYERRGEMAAQVRLALIYPVFILVVGSGMVAVFMIKMVPALAGMFNELGQSLPLATRLLIAASNLTIHWGWVLPVAAAVAVILFRGWLRRPENRMRWDRKKLFWPMVGRLVSKSEFARFSQTLATLLESGIPLNQAIRVVAETLENLALKDAARAAQVQVTQGFALSQTLKGSGLFPELMIDMVAVGERTGSLTHSLQQAAKTYERELDRELKYFISLIGPAMIIVMALFVGTLVLSILSAVFNLTSGLNKL